MSGFRRGVKGYVRAGKDTLAYPLTMKVPPGAGEVDTRVFTLRIMNRGDTVVVLDNLRLEPPARRPLGAVLWDFGELTGRVWPGFTRRGKGSEGIKWPDEISCYSEYSLSYPDPLTRDFVGPQSSSLGNNSKVSVVVTAPKATSMAAWLWVTHYGQGFCQPQEYMCRAAAGRPIRKKLNPGQLVGSEGLLEGAAGAWTPQWYATDYAEHFVTLMPFTMTKGKTKIELGNCQMAALAMAPISSRSSMAACVKQIRSELVRFRRQFVMKRLNRNLCKLEPTEAEKKRGLMLFRVPADEAFTGLWRPRADQRAWAIHEIARPGGTIRIPLGFVSPQRKAKAVSVATGTLRSKSGAILPLDRNGLKIEFVHCVPQVRSNVAIRRPWLLARKAAPVDVGQIGYVWVSIAVPAVARSGLYRGTWKLASGVARAGIPVEIEIVGCSPIETKELTIGSFGLPDASYVYRAALSALPYARQRKLRSTVFNAVKTTGINAYSIPAVSIITDSAGSLVLGSSDLQEALGAYPFKDLSGTMLLHLGRALRTAGWGGSDARKALIEKAITSTNSLCSKYSTGRSYFYFGFSSTMADGTYVGLTKRLTGAARFAGQGCSVAVGATSSLLKDLGAADFNKKLLPVSALILTPDSSALASQITAFKKLDGDREVYLKLTQADRFAMGFYLAAVGADGCFLKGVFMSGAPYNGYYVDGHGLVAPQPGGSLARTVSAFRMRQGRDDRELVYQARALVEKAASAKVSAVEISDVLSEIMSRAASLDGLTYTDTLFATSEVSQAEMDSWRASLLNAIGVVNRRFGAPKR